MSPDRLARRGSFRSPILASRLAELGFPLKARDTRCVEMSPRLKTASTPGPTDDEISTSFETMWGRFLLALVVDAVYREAHAPIRPRPVAPGDGDHVVVRERHGVLHEI